jgi:reductive dehalogenase
MRFHSNRDRAQHLGPFALERLARAADAPDSTGTMPPEVNAAASDASIIDSAREYSGLFAALLEGPIAPAHAPIPADPVKRAENLKAAAYFLDASVVGCCEIKPDDWPGAMRQPYTHALVFLIEFGREPEAGEPGDLWIRGTNIARTDVRCAELAAILAGYIRSMGYSASGHFADTGALDLARLAVRAGIVRIDADGALAAPFLRRGFRIGVVSTEYALAADTPLQPGAVLDPADANTYMGVGGTQPGWHYDEESRRPMHMGSYPMETIKRVDEPTTLIIRSEISRISKRGDFFKRASGGDLGEKPKRERANFAYKHPLARGMQPLIVQMVPLQGTRHKLQPSGWGGDASDNQRNAQAIKALGYYLGADFVGICRAEPWMYYSHDEVEGKPIEAYHEYAVVMLMDQGYETMEGSSGDDWVSASQSMRAYLRGAEMAGIMAAHCRRMGYSSRTHSNAHSEVIHNPAILMAGLAEVSRIGDTLLNPFIGPRSKSVVFTTDLPMEIDKPIDFGLQDFCNQCRKCARECPCNAISFGPKVMFNGYEIWKADVEKCTKYRVTQTRGSACGRCMKMCPWNREDTVEARRLADLSINVPSARPAIIKMDDELQNGKRNLMKRWWFDLEVIDGVAVTPPGGTNERDLNLGRDDKLAKIQRLAMFPPALQPAGGTTLNEVVPVDREAGLKAYVAAERPDDARRRSDKNHFRDSECWPDREPA